MIPTNNNLSDIEIETIPTKTYKLSIGDENIKGYCDELEAMKQAIYLILNTERYENIIYSWDYGIELNELYGQDIGYVYPELKRRIEEALLQDDRINSVDSFLFEKNKGKVNVSFIVHTQFGDIETSKEVDI